MKKLFYRHLILVGLLASGTASAYDVEFGADSWCTNGVSVGGYVNNIPNGWSAGWTKTEISSKFILSDRGGPARKPKSSLCLNLCNEARKQQGELKMDAGICVPQGEIVCDNISAKLILYVYHSANSVDMFQLIATTNGWKDTIEIGNPIPIYDSRYSEGWKTNDVVGSIKGISRIGPDGTFQVGVRVTTGGDSQVYGYLHGVSIKFVACATPDNPVLVSSCEKKPNIDNPLQSPIVPGLENGRMAVRVNLSPADKIDDLRVYGVLTRKNGICAPVTNELEEIDGVYYERDVDVANRPPFDAGEVVSCSVFTRYKSKDPVSPLGDMGDDGYAYEFAKSGDYDVGKFGSVWINELGMDSVGQCFVELCGTTNRTYLGGWQVVLAGEGKEGTYEAYTNYLGSAFDFTANMTNGVVGIVTNRWSDLDNVTLENASLELKNSAGVVEFSKTGITSFPTHYQMTGKAKWHGKNDNDWSYDWTGTATNKTFEFESSDGPSSFGYANQGQGFCVPVGTMFYYTTLIQGDAEVVPLPYASILVEADGILNDGDGKKSFPAQPTDEDGTACIQVSGYSDDASAVPLQVYVSAFGWKLKEAREYEGTNISLYADAVYLTNFVASTIAVDDFSKLQEYWLNESTITHTKSRQIINWGTIVDASQGSVLRLDTRNADVGAASLTTKSYIALRGKKNLDISFNFRNESRDTDEGATLAIIVADTPDFSKGHTYGTSVLSNRRRDYLSERWYSVREFIGVPVDFAREGMVWVRVVANVKTSNPGVETRLDNLRIAAQDSVKINEFKMDVPAGDGKHFPLESKAELDISPLTGGIVSNFVEEVLTSVETNYVRKVAADLVLTINGTEFAVPFSFADGSLTNDISAAEENVKLTIAPSTITKMTGGFLPGDEVQYYVRVTYDPDNADDSGERDARYYPDNATPTANGWRVENGYAPVVQSLSITDKPALTLVGKPETTTDGARFTVHGCSANMLSEVSIYVNGEKCAQQPFAYLGTNNQIRVTGEFVIETGLNASTTYTVTIKGKDGTGAELQEATFEFLTKPTEPDITGVPEEGAYSPTKAFDFYALAEADDVTKLNFHWLLDDAATKSGNGETNYTDVVEAEGPHTVRVYVTDRENNVSPTNSLSWFVDTVKPTKPVVAGTPANGSVTNGVAYDLSAKSEDVNLDAFYWILDGAAGVRALPEEAFRDNVADGFGLHKVKCYAVDKAGNVSETNSWTWTVDTLAPTDLEIDGYPANGSVTSGTSFRLTATAKDDTELTYWWSLDGAAGVRALPGEAFENSVPDGYGKHVVTCYATDEAGNVSVTNSWKWTVDTVAPTKPEISGTPTKGSVTNEPNFNLSAMSTDKTLITYHWLTNGVAAVAVTNFEGKVTTEGEFVVSCYATDEANNVSETNSVSWTYDQTPPTVPVMSGAPVDGAVTNGTEYGFAATALDVHLDAFYWSLDGAAGVRALPGVALKGNVGDGYAKHTVRVFATDTAGNRSAETNWTWTVDTKKPTDLKLTGLPVSDKKIIVTNGFDFAFTASANDDMELTYHWKTNGVEVADCTSSNFVGQVSEGTNTVSVYAKDEAGNVCDPVERMWVVDTHAPTKPTIGGTPKDGAITNVKEYEFTAESEDATEIAYHWTLKRGGDTASTGDEEAFGGSFAKDGGYAVFVYATDEAGNVSETNSWSWIVDTTAPTAPVISGTPANGSVTNEPNFSLKAEAKDATLITYHWLTNGVAAVDATNLVGKVEEEGLFEVKCYATDAAGNVSKTNDWSWTLDRTSPTKPMISGAPTAGVITNDKSYNFKAEATDAHFDAYYWLLDGATGVRALPETPFAGGELSDGSHTVCVYAKDVAGNVSETNSISWSVDTVRPTVTLASTATSRFNRKAAPMEVTATFSEEVTNFTYECVTVQTGTVSNEVETVEEKKVFKFWVYPEHYGVPTFIDEETVSVSIDANKVRDYAGNGNEASRNEQGTQAPLTRIYDTKSPIVSLTSETPGYFNEKYAPLKVKISVTGKGVTELAQESIVITNGEVSAFRKVEEKAGEDGVVTEQIYAVEVTPTKEALITVALPEGVVTNSSENVNPAADPSVTRTYDNTPPMNLVISGEPAQGKVTAAKTFDFEATADDLTAMTFHWTLNGVAVTGNETPKYSGVVEKGTNWVTVSATDAAGNTCAEVKRTWVVDFEDPVPGPEGITGVPAEGAVTNGTDFSFVFTATDATKIMYHWTTNGVDVSDYFSTNFVGVGTAIEGTNVVTVYAQDEASNRCDAVMRTWVVDTINPANLVISGTPEDRSVTNGVAYDLTARADDATALEFHWSIDGKAETVTHNFKGVVESGYGTHEVKCYATDEAGNKSYTTNWTWTVDTLAPTDLEISGRPADGSVTNGTSFSLTATAKDDMARTYRWSLDGGAWTDPMAEGEAYAKDDLEPGFWSHEVLCFATDMAGNVSETNGWRWTIDTVAPTNLVVAGAPAYDAVTNVAAFAFEASALDDTALRYHWLTNGIEVVSTNLVGTAEEGTNTVQVWAEDAAGNVSVTNEIRWILDTIAPTKPVIDGRPTPGAFTNEKAFSFSATAEDKTALTFFWTVDEQKQTGPEFSGEVDGDGEHTVSVYAMDAAGNVSETSTFTWTLDTKAPENLVITGTPADGSATNKPNYSLSATAEDATTLTFHWTLGEKTEAVTNFIGEVETEGAYEVTCYATDAAGNSSVTNTWCWTFDRTPPSPPVIDGTPENGSVVNKPNYDLTAESTDNLTTITYHWMTNGVAAADVTNFVGEVNAEGVYEVSCYATDAADNVSATNTWSWTFDKTPPADLAISGKPDEGEVVATNGFSFAASATDLTHVTYLWTLNGGSESTGEDFVGVASEGTNVVKVTATDEAGNVSTVSRTWVVDTIAPTNLHFVVALPGDKVYTNDVNFAYMAVAEDATEMTFRWTLDDGAAGVRALPMDVAFTNDAPLAEGEHTVSVYTEDEAGNVSETNSVSWTVDLTPPTVTLSTDITEDHVINLADVFVVTVAFSEPVVGFTKDSVMVGNGTVTNVAASAEIENAYEVMIAPTADGMVSVRIEEGAVTDLAGNGNLASEPLERECDVTRPTVTLESEMIGAFNAADLENDAFVVTVSFSEPVTGFTKDSVTVTNGKVVSVVESDDAENAYCVKITPNDLRGECEISIQVAENVVEDQVGNGNVASEVLTCTYDNKNPTRPVISGTPENGATTKDPNVTLFLTTPSTDLTEITYLWEVYDCNGDWIDEVVDTSLTTVVAQAGEYEVEFFAMDEAGNMSDPVVWSWTYEPGETPSAVPFGNSVQLKIAEEGVTNVVLTAVDFQPGAISTFALREFELRESQETTKEIDDLKMWFVVGTNLLDDIRWTVKVNEFAGFTNGTLTVTIPAEATTKDGQPKGESHESFFIFGIDNKGSDK